MSLLAAMAAVAEEGVAASPNHAELRLGLTRGVHPPRRGDRGSRRVRAPDVKSIQMDSMIRPRAPPVAEGGAAPQVMFRVAQFADNLRRSPARCSRRMRQGVRERDLHQGVGVRGLPRAPARVALAGGCDGGEGKATLRETSCGGGVTVRDCEKDPFRRRDRSGDGRVGRRGEGVPVPDRHAVAERAVQRGPRRHGFGAAAPRSQRARRPGLVDGRGGSRPTPRCAVAVAGAHARAQAARARPWRTARVGARARAVRGDLRAPPRGARFRHRAERPSPGLNALAAVRAIRDACAKNRAATPTRRSRTRRRRSPVTADADKVSDAMLAAVASLLRLGTDGEFGSRRTSPPRPARSTRSPPRSRRCARARGGSPGGRTTTRWLARRTAPFLSRFTPSRTPASARRRRFSRVGGGPG